MELFKNFYTTEIVLRVKQNQSTRNVITRKIGSYNIAKTQEQRQLSYVNRSMLGYQFRGKRSTPLSDSVVPLITL